MDSFECFAIEWNGDCWQSVFPTKWAEHSQLHTTVQDAAEYIAEVVALIGPEVDVPKELTNELD